MFSLFKKKPDSQDDVGSMPDFLKKFEYFTENQRGKWLRIERDNAKKLAEYGALSDVLTATFQRPVGVPTRMLENNSVIGNDKKTTKTEDLEIQKIATLMNQEEWKWSKKNIPFINIEYNGKARIYTGYTVICGAQIAGKASIPVWLSYYVGGELVRGDFSPEKLYEIYRR